MRFPDAVMVLRPSGVDEYGNPGVSWATAVESAAVGFHTGKTVFMPHRSDVQRGDRLRIGARLFDVVGEPEIARSPSRPVLLIVTIERRLT